MKRFFVLMGVAVFLLLSHSQARAQDDQYLRVYGLIQEGDGLKNSGKSAEALAKYLEAQNLLQSFQRLYPDWNSNVVKYRVGYLAARIAEISKIAPVSPQPQPQPGSPANPPSASRTEPSTNDLDARLGTLQSQVRQLQMEKTILEAKLKESLSVQPAAADPRELAKAEQHIKTLQKENDLLKVNLSQQPTRTGSTVDPKVLEELKRQLADANRQLADQTNRASALASEKSDLENKLNSLIPAAWNSTNVDNTKKALEDANRKLAEQTDIATRLALEKTALQMRVKSLMSESEAAAALRAENEILKRQVADLKSTAPGKVQDLDRRLAEAQAQIAALQSDKELLRQEKASLESRVRQLSVPTTVASAMPSDASADSQRVKQLERERDDLQKKLDSAQRELYGRNSKVAAARMQDLSSQLEVLRTRLAVMEAQKIPYTPEELALFKRPETQIDSHAGKKSIQELPAGAATLVAQAQRDFAARNFDKAEEKYLQVLHQDEKNVYTLANLAAIQLELGHFDEAEKHLRKALDASPDDPYSLSMLGFLKFRQQKYDDALDVLGRAAKLDPRNSEIQNYLGLTLSQKGMRVAAETALRKAIEINPGYASAHYNLAVIYVMQKPSAVALARWHYDKARSNGLPPNPEMEKMLNQNKTEGSTEKTN